MKSICLAVAILAAQPAFGQTKAKAQNVPDIPYESVPGFLKLPPNLYLGEGIGVATNSKGHVFVYTRRREASRLAAAERSSSISRGKTAIPAYELPQSPTAVGARTEGDETPGAA